MSSSSRKRGGADQNLGIIGIGCPVQYLHVQETWKGRKARARARTVVAWFETKLRIKFRIIFQNICITFPLCSREHASSILESIAAASALVAGRTFSLREGIRVHKVARSPTIVPPYSSTSMRAMLRLSGRNPGF
jgi:hypothetical protein